MGKGYDKSKKGEEGKSLFLNAYRDFRKKNMFKANQIKSNQNNTNM